MNKLKFFTLTLLSFASMNSFCEAIKINFSQPIPNESGTILNDSIDHIALSFETTPNMQYIQPDLTEIKQQEISFPADAKLKKISANVNWNQNIHVILYKKDENSVKSISTNDIDLSQIDTIDIEAYYTPDQDGFSASPLPMVIATITYKQPAAGC